MGLFFGDTSKDGVAATAVKVRTMCERDRPRMSMERVSTEACGHQMARLRTFPTNVSEG